MGAVEPEGRELITAAAIARLAGAQAYHDHPPVTFGYYTYWRGSPVTGMHALLEPGRFFGIFPVGGGLALAFVQGPRAQYPAFRRDPLPAYVSELRSRPALAGMLAGAVIAMIPCVVVYVALQRYYVRGLISGALKG